jgi:predicted nicotinamide N-methyase
MQVVTKEEKKNTMSSKDGTPASRKEDTIPTSSPFLNEPTELSKEEYLDLIQEIQSSFTVQDCQGELLDAARYNDIDVVRALIKCHPDLLNYQDEKSGNTALHMAAANGHHVVVQLLLSAGADATVINQAGNTPLHWASASGKDLVVEILLAQSSQDVLKRNAFGRSALTEGFSSENTALVKHLLEHDSATEELLMQSPGTGNDSITHALVLGRNSTSPVKLKVRELAIAKSSKDSILGQSSPDEDTTGLGIWATSLVCAQWMLSLDFTGKVVLELGAGCGIPALAIAAANARKVYLTDFNSQTVANLKHNVQLNGLDNEEKCQVLNMNWQDPSTWPTEKVDILIGSDLIYQSDMVPLLLQTIRGLLSEQGRFFYVAPDSGRQGQDEFFSLITQEMELISESKAPDEYSENPLETQDDEECFLHFNELTNSVGDYKLYEFKCNTVS